MNVTYRIEALIVGEWVIWASDLTGYDTTHRSAKLLYEAINRKVRLVEVKESIEDIWGDGE